MSKVLYITCNPKKEEESYSLSIGRRFLNLYKQRNTQDEIIEIDLYKIELPIVDIDVITGWNKSKHKDSLTYIENTKLQEIDQFVNQFVDADKYIFVSPLWNMSIPTKLKQYIDTVMVAGKTFKYSSTGMIGLLKDKKALHIQASGGTYSIGKNKHLEFGNSYLKALLKAVGVRHIDSILVESTSKSAYIHEKIMEKADKRIEEVLSTF